MLIKRLVLVVCLLSGLVGVTTAAFAGSGCPSASSLSAVTLSRVKLDTEFESYTAYSPNPYRLGTRRNWYVGVDVDTTKASSKTEALHKAQAYLAKAKGPSSSELVFDKFLTCQYDVPGDSLSQITLASPPASGLKVGLTNPSLIKYKKHKH